jgi:DNA adenine methylase
MNASQYTKLEIAFATFLLNRCNVSGIIAGGPIGGNNQTGNYGLDARFNKKELIRKIQNIYKERERIYFSNIDAKEFLRTLPDNFGWNETILNIDPPYVKKGPMLYENSFSIEDHEKLAQIIMELPYKWMVTYDECETIYNLYPQYRKEIIILNYSIGNSKNGKELIIYSDNIDLRIPQAQ